MLRVARASIFFGLLGVLTAPACNSVDYEDLDGDQVDALCDYLARCGLFDDADYCVEVYGRVFQSDPDLDAAIDNGTVLYDDKAAKECLDGIRDASCETTFNGFTVDACDEVLQGTIDDGGACWISEQCISGVCLLADCMESCCMGACIAAPPDAALGEPCGGGQACAAGYCDYNTAICSAIKPAGSSCSNDVECGDFFCLGDTCQASLAESAPCIDGKCGAPWLGCDVDSNTCQRLRGEGESCNPEADICSLGLICPEASPTCSRPGGVGSPCDDVFGFDCAVDAWCDYDFVTGEGICQPLKAAGISCENDQECDTRYCGDTNVCEVEPVCVQ